MNTLLTTLKRARVCMPQMLFARLTLTDFLLHQHTQWANTHIVSPDVALLNSWQWWHAKNIIHKLPCGLALPFGDHPHQQHAFLAKAGEGMEIFQTLSSINAVSCLQTLCRTMLHSTELLL